MMANDDNQQFWDLVGPLIAMGQMDEGTIMGGPCVRVKGEFLAMPYHKGSGLVVKIPKERVTELIEQNVGQPFAPAGRVFREWVLVEKYNAAIWTELLAEGRAFVSK